MSETDKLSNQEIIKRESKFLRGSIAAELADNSTGEVSAETAELLKFHGAYFGYNRDSAAARDAAGIPRDFEFMVRIKCPAGRLSAAQYLGLDALCDKYADGTLRITDRQAIQFQGVKKSSLKALIADINHLGLSTFGAYGDVVRNITASPAPIHDNVHLRIDHDAYLLAKYMTPKTSAYYELWLDGEIIPEYPFNPEPGNDFNPEPLYGKTYMPLGFTIGIAAPDDNCIDVLSNDLAILPLFNGQELTGYNFALGGPVATPIMFVPPELFIQATEAVIKLQRDYGDRGDRDVAALKNIVVEDGAAWVKQTLEGYILQNMEAPRPMADFAVREHMGWHAQGDGKWYLGLPILSGRIADRDSEKIRSGLHETISEYGMNVNLTADQHIILCDIDESEKIAIEYKLARFGIKFLENVTPAYRYAMASVALPACSKAVAEAERIAEPLIGEIEQMLEKYSLADEKIAIRIAGGPDCFNRAYSGDIGIIGVNPGHYDLYMGGNIAGTNLAQKIYENVPLAEIANVLAPLFFAWGRERLPNECFGDFIIRAKPYLAAN